MWTGDLLGFPGKGGFQTAIGNVPGKPERLSRHVRHYVFVLQFFRTDNHSLIIITWNVTVSALFVSRWSF